MRYSAGTFNPNLRIPEPTVFDRVVWLVVGYWLNILGLLFVWLRWRKRSSFVRKMAVKWALLGTAANIITIVMWYTLF